MVNGCVSHDIILQWKVRWCRRTLETNFVLTVNVRCGYFFIFYFNCVYLWLFYAISLFDAMFNVLIYDFSVYLHKICRNALSIMIFA